MSNPKDRRQFLRNISLVTAGLGLAPASISAKSSEPGEIACVETTLDYYGEGPFYTANPPTIAADQLAGPSEPGTRMIISGRVHTLDCTQVIPDCEIDIWHADDAGAYDNIGYNLRGVVTSNPQGFYLFETIKPGKYLNGSKYRPSHIHFKLTPPGFSTLITQLYFDGDTDRPADAAASITSGTYNATGRIIPLTMNAGKYEGTWDIVVDGNGVNGMRDLHLDTGMIYSVSPNPYSDRIEIRYGVFKSSKVSLAVYDLNGRLVATLEEKNLSADKYTAFWTPGADLPSGHYFIALKVNDLQVHYLKTRLQD